MLQRAQGAGVLTSQQADAIASGTESVPNVLDTATVNSLFTNPVEVVAFSDEEGIRYLLSCSLVRHSHNGCTP